MRIVHKHFPLTPSEQFFYDLGLGVHGEAMMTIVTDPSYVPLDVLGLDSWTDPTGVAHQGGLYPFGSNTPPYAHGKNIKTANKNIFPRNASGVKDLVAGKIGFLVMGASNPMHICNALMPAYAADPYCNNKVTIVNGGEEGRSIEKMFTSAYFSTTMNDVLAAGLTAQQVQCVWFKTDTLDNNINALSFDDYIDAHIGKFYDAMQRIQTDYPNCQIVYFTGRHTTAYALEGYEKHFEPRGYYNSWITKYLIEEQINGNPELKCKGPGKCSPVLAWARPFYSAGETPNTFGYSVSESYFIPAGDGAINNGIHLSESGLDSAADYLLDFFFTDPNTKIWFKA